ncbi:MAG TPA: hypothetical protein VH590_05330, partial [Ktedonobacterales bacterium]
RRSAAMAAETAALHWRSCARKRTILALQALAWSARVGGACAGRIGGVASSREFIRQARPASANASAPRKRLARRGWEEPQRGLVA